MISTTASSPWWLGLLFFSGLIIFLLLLWLFNFIVRLLSVLKLTLTALFFKRLIFPGSMILTIYFLQIISPYFIPSLSEKLSRIFMAISVFFIIVFFLRLIDSFILIYYQKKQRSFPLPRVLHGFVLAIFYIVAFFIILRSGLRVNITPFLATSALLTAILGLAFQGVLSNVLAGLSLNFSHALNRGDWVQIGSYEGVVEEMNWRETILLDRASNFVILPNNVVASEKIINFSRPDKSTALILETKVSYDNKPALVIVKLLEAAREIVHVLPHPEPQAFVASYDHLGVNYWLKFWIKDFSRKNLILGEVGRQVWYKFQRYGIKVPVPLSMTLKEVIAALEPQRAAIEAEEEARTNYIYLLRSDFLRYEEGEKAGELIIPAEDITAFASQIKRENYTRGEILFRQGEKGDNCFVVAKGKLRGEIIYEDKGRQYLSEFEVAEGGLVGEMSLFTGMPRTATIIAAEETELLKISAPDFARLLEKHAGLSEAIAEMVSQRTKKNQEFLKKIQSISSEDIEFGCNSRSILSRLKQLITLLRQGETYGEMVAGPKKIS